MYSAAKTYQRMEVESAVMSASPVELIRLLMDGAISRLELAARMAEKKQFESRAQASAAAIDIIDGLQQSLDRERGADLASSLHELYGYMQRKLLTSGADNDPNGFREVAGLLSELRSGWQELSARQASAG